MNRPLCARPVDSLDVEADRRRLNALENDAFKGWRPLSVAEGGLTADEREAMHGLYAAMRIIRETNFPRWYKNPKTGEAVERNFGEVIALMHSELSEALEAHRKNLMDDKLTDRLGIEVELADVITRVLDTAAEYGLDVPGALIAVNRNNRVRKDHSDEARAAGHGKAY